MTNIVKSYNGLSPKWFEVEIVTKKCVVYGKASVHSSLSVKMVGADIYNYYFIYQASKFIIVIVGLDFE